MMEDESVRTYISRVSEIIAGIKAYGGTKDEDEIISKILKTLTPLFKKTTMMIELVIHCIEKISKETLIGRLVSREVSLNKNWDLPKIETEFNALSMKPRLSRSVSTNGNFKEKK